LLLRKYWAETWLLWSACAFILIVFPWVRLWAVSQFELAGFAPLIEQLRVLEKFSPVPLEQFLTHEGIIGLTFAEPVLLLSILTFSIARGSDVVSGEIGRGTMEMLLAQPISRLKVMAAHGIVSVGGLMSLTACCWLGLYLGILTNITPVAAPKTTLSIPLTGLSISNPFEPTKIEMTPLYELVSPSLYLPSCLNLFALGFFVYALSVFMSSWDMYRWRTIGLVMGIYVLQLLLFVLSKSTPRARFLMPFSFFGAYQPDWMVQAISREHMPMFALYRIRASYEGFLGDVEIGPLGYTSILLGLGSLLYIGGAVIFNRRDIPAPS
jgi:ABC-2 type transport system permease protein